MIPVRYLRDELTAAIARGVRQFVVLGPRPQLQEAVRQSSKENLDVIAVTHDDGLAAALLGSNFDKSKASLFLWLGDAGFRSVDAVLNALALIASLPAGSGVLVDYMAERCGVKQAARAALDALASRFAVGDRVAYCIHPQALAELLRAMGFREVADVADEEVSLGGRLISAVV